MTKFREFWFKLDLMAIPLVVIYVVWVGVARLLGVRIGDDPNAR